MSKVYYIPKLKNNLLSIDQLQERNLKVFFEGNTCKIYHSTRGLIIDSHMSSNRMFKTLTDMISPTCFKATGSTDASILWHNRYRHLSFKGLKTLSEKTMVKGIPKMEESTKVCEDCVIGRQHRDPLPK